MNAVGGQDELVFDGGSMMISPDGGVRHRATMFEEDLLIVDIHGDASFADEREPWPTDAAETYGALVLGLGDYVRKNGFDEVVLGLSGGIDSALTAALAVDALGADAVRGLAMPSPYSSPESVEDAAECANRLGIRIDTVPITPTLDAYRHALAELFAGTSEDVTEENLQARIRGNMLMALSNKFGSIVLATGNKSEYAMGYSTLYGDMAGGFAPIKDVPKTLVYKLAIGATPTRTAEGTLPRSPTARSRSRRAPNFVPIRRTPTPCPLTRSWTLRSRPTSRRTSASTTWSNVASSADSPSASSRWSTATNTSAGRLPRASRSPRRRSDATGACRSPTATRAEFVVPGERAAEAVLITGAYGTGKSSLAAQIADMLEARGLRYAALDLDWLAWGYPGSEEASAEHRMMMKNLAPVVANYHEAGVRFFVLAGAFTERWELEDLIAEFPCRLRLVRLEVPPEVIEERLHGGIDAGRHDELRALTGQVARTPVPGVDELNRVERPAARGDGHRVSSTGSAGWSDRPLPRKARLTPDGISS